MTLTLKKIILKNVGYLFILPWLIGLFAFTIGPISSSLIFSLYDYDAVTRFNFIGLENYINIFRDPLFYKSLRNTAYYSFLGIPLSMVISLILAILLNQKIKLIGFFRSLCYLPSTLSGAAVSLLWMWVFNSDFGVLNLTLRIFGINGPKWLNSEEWVIPAFVLMGLWGIGNTVVIFLAGLQGIPDVYYEAALIDGANRWILFWKITLPLMSPTIFFTLVMGIIGSFQIFTPAYIMTNGGPNNASLFYVLHLYNNAFLYLKMGYGCALAWILFIIILALVSLIIKSTPLWVYYESEVK
ncbi:MAG: sugar ABC transporter permease [Nitrososphaeria archaeon]